MSQHLLKCENERVEVHEIRGFLADDLHGALQESYAVSRATRCKQHLYSLSLNPPKNAIVENSEFVATIDRVEQELGLRDQPRAIVFHEKNGRRHAHAVWSRIDTERGRAIHLPFTKNKLQEISRDIYIERGWEMPLGFVDKNFVDPRNFTLAEWQQAKRAEKDPKKLKGFFQDSWAISDSRASFSHALQERGFYLARGDRRGFIAVDHTGEAYSLSRWVGVKTKALKERLGEPSKLPSKEDAHAKAALTITTRLEDLQAELCKKADEEQKALIAAQEKLSAEQGQAEARLKAEQTARASIENQAREGRLRKGLFGLWDRVTGKRRKTIRENTKEEERCLARDVGEIEGLRAKFEAEEQQRAERAKVLVVSALTQSTCIASDIAALRQELRLPAERETKRNRNRKLRGSGNTKNQVRSRR